MSATKRGKARNRNDYYATPHWCVHRLLERLKLPAGNWLEPGCGEGDIIQAASKHVRGVRWTALELREVCRPLLEKLEPRPEIIITDKFLTAETPLRGRQFDLVLGNPPFSLAMPFIKASLEVSQHVVFLLRLNYIGTDGRHAFMCEHMPDIYVLPNRPSFTNDGDTDSIEYAWFHWDRERKGRQGRIELLDLTPKAERKIFPLNLTLPPPEEKTDEQRDEEVPEDPRA